MLSIMEPHIVYFLPPNYQRSQKQHISPWTETNGGPIVAEMRTYGNDDDDITDTIYLQEVFIKKFIFSLRGPTV